MRGGRVSRYWTGISVRGIAVARIMKEKRQPCRADLRTSLGFRAGGIDFRVRPPLPFNGGAIRPAALRAFDQQALRPDSLRVGNQQTLTAGRGGEAPSTSRQLFPARVCQLCQGRCRRRCSDRCSAEDRSAGLRHLITVLDVSPAPRIMRLQYERDQEPIIPHPHRLKAEWLAIQL